MATKTVTMNGAELCVAELGGLNALIVNNTSEVLYASAKAGVVPYADGVIEIKAGASRGLPDANGTVCLLGNGGRVEVTGGINFNQPSQSLGGGGGVTRAEVDGIVTDKIAEVVANATEDFDTLREISDWIDGHEDSAAAMNSEIKANAADISDIQQEQETQNTSISALQIKMEQKADISEVSNLNLLDNADFKINQRGLSEYTAAGYTADRWKKTTNGIVVIEKDCLLLDNTLGTSPMYFGQPLWADIGNTTVTLTANTANDIIYTISGVAPSEPKDPLLLYMGSIGRMYVQFTDNRNEFFFRIEPGQSIKLANAKLEPGDNATPFVPPNPALELLKCQRYYQIRSTGDINPVDLRPTMRIIPTITQLDDGNYAYSADL